MPRQKGTPKTGGRKKGVPNKATAEVKKAAQEHTEAAIKVLVEVAENGESEAARVSAANALLDRGHGKPTQAITGEDSGPVRIIVDTGIRRG